MPRMARGGAMRARVSRTSAMTAGVSMPRGRLSARMPVARPVRSPMPAESAECHRDQANGAKGECSEVEIHGFGELKVALA